MMTGFWFWLRTRVETWRIERSEPLHLALAAEIVQRLKSGGVSP